jgi:purine-binding chemotaxis protein CheW
MAGEAGRPGGRADWAEIRRRVEAAGRALSGDAALSGEQARSVLEERARALARPTAPPADEGVLEAVGFSLAGETYAIEARFVVEVFRLAELALLPGVQQPTLGVTAWRGDLLTVLDLRSALGLASPPLTDLGRVLVLGGEQPAFGVLVDAVGDLLRLPLSDIRPASETAAGARRHLRGITSRAVLVLDAEEVLSAYS